MLGGAIAGLISTSCGLRNFVSSSLPCPSGVRIITMSTWTPSSPLTRSTHGPLDRHLAFDRHPERGEKSPSGCKVFDDDTDVVQSLDRHVPSIAKTVRGISDHGSLLLLLIFQNIARLTF